MGEGGITRYSSSSAEVSIDRLPVLRIPGLRSVGSLGVLECPDEVAIGRVGEPGSSRSSTWIAGVVLRSSVTIDGISGWLPLSILEWVEIREKSRRGGESRQGQVNERVNRRRKGGGNGRERMRKTTFSTRSSVGNAAQPHEFANYRGTWHAPTELHNNPQNKCLWTFDRLGLGARRPGRGGDSDNPPSPSAPYIPIHKTYMPACGAN